MGLHNDTTIPYYSQTLSINKQVYVEPRPSALNMTPSACAARARAAADIHRQPVRGAGSC